MLQLGTPDSTEVSDVRRYLRQFLSDRRVLDLPAPARFLLLNLVILPFRPRRSAEAYEKIWTEEGSPLMIHTSALATKVAELLGDGYVVEYGMRYQNPSIESAVESLCSRGCDRLILVPLFPQYASASGGSAIAEAMRIVTERWNVPEVTALGDFHDAPGFIESMVDVARPLLEAFAPDHVLFSYHGLPEKHLAKSQSVEGWCLSSDSCCDRVGTENRFCYRAQCHATTRAAASALSLDRYSTSFQSRLAGQKWIEPYTDHVLPQLYQRGVRCLAVLTPSFTSDCLETIEEIGIRGRRQWEGLGGEDFLLVPCVNASDLFAKTVARMVVDR